MTALEKVTADLAASRSTIKAALEFVASVTNEDQAGEVYDRVKLAKEWAKIRKIHAQVAGDLLRLEIHCLRKIGQLGAVSVLPGQTRTVAQFFADKSDAQIEELIATYGAGTSPGTVYRRQQAAAAHDASRDFHTGTYDGYRPTVEESFSDEDISEVRSRYRRDIKTALSVIVADYGDGDDSFNVHEMGERLCQEVGIDEKSAEWGAREGMLEVCRKAIREAPDIAIHGTKAPKFITCLAKTEDLDGRPAYIRVPFHSATLHQLRQMVDLRQSQAEAAQAVATDLNMLLGSLYDALVDEDGSIAEHRVALGELAMRMAQADSRGNHVWEPDPNLPRPMRIGQTSRSAAIHRRRKSA